MNKTKRSYSPWTWVSTLYFAEGLPYVAVMTLAVIMYKRLGLSNTEIALYTSWLYLPWVIKPIWSPFIDIIKTKRWWIIAMQSLIAVGFAGIAFTIPSTFFIKSTLAFFWLLAFSSATHDIAADGFYMLALDSGDQSFFVGIRNTFYRLANICGQGLLVMFAGWLEVGIPIKGVKASIPLAWSITFYLMCALFIGFTIYHKFILPYPKADITRPKTNIETLFKEVGNTFVTFFQKKNVGLMFFFLLTYRLGESQLVKITSPFLLDPLKNGGLALSTSKVGLVYGSIGVVALLLGGIVGGMLVSQKGFKKWIIPMAFAINAPDILYVLLAHYQPTSLGVISTAIALEQFGYGFGFTAYTLYLIYIAKGFYETAHYAIGTGFMALGMMLPGMAAGWIQEHIGYSNFFIWVCICTIPGIVASFLVQRKMDPLFGKKQ